MKRIRILDKYINELMAESTPENPIWNREKMLSGAKGSWNYIDGCMCKSLLDLYEITQETKYFDFVKNFIDHYIQKDGSIKTYNPLAFNLDNINEGRVLLSLYKKTNQDNYLIALRTLYRQLEFQPRTKAGSWWHMLKFPYEVWLDGLYMAQPYYLEYELTFNGGRNVQDMMMQFRNIYNTNRDSETGLYYHGYDETKWIFWANEKTGRSANFWLRALGWFLMALIDCCELLTDNYLKEKMELQQMIQELVTSLLKYQDEDTGMWYQVINLSERKNNYLETSGTAIISYGIQKGVRLGILEKEYLAKAQKAFYGTCEKLNRLH